MALTISYRQLLVAVGLASGLMWAQTTSDIAHRLPPIASGGIAAEEIAGPWEADDPIAGKPAQIGVYVKIWAWSQVLFEQRKITEEGAQQISQLEAHVYQRIGGVDKGVWLLNNGKYQNLSWDGHRLQSESPYGLGQFDLTFDEQSESWKGTYTREGTTKPVQLVRPVLSPAPVSNPFVGAWFENGLRAQALCVHIAQESDGTLTAWSDSRTGPSIDRRDPPGTATCDEMYAHSLKAESTGDTLILHWVKEGPGPPPRTFTGKLSSDGAQIVGARASTAIAVPTEQTASFSRRTISSCLAQIPTQSLKAGAGDASAATDKASAGEASDYASRAAALGPLGATRSAESAAASAADTEAAAAETAAAGVESDAARAAAALAAGDTTAANAAQTQGMADYSTLLATDVRLINAANDLAKAASANAGFYGGPSDARGAINDLGSQDASAAANLLSAVSKGDAVGYTAAAANEAAAAKDANFVAEVASWQKLRTAEPLFSRRRP